MIPPEAWVPADGVQLEPNALKAATEQQRNIVLTAGPGAGKTEMLAQRADFLLRTGRCAYPKRILAISFKVDAALNLQRRVAKRSGVLMARRFESRTFHSFALRVITVCREVLTGSDALVEGFSIGEQRIAGQQITYREFVPLACSILERAPLARAIIAATYSDVLLDEFQDCTNEQYKLISLLARNPQLRMCAVGDTKQRIMGWAGALEGIFERFAADHAGLPLNLYQNFRAQPRLRRVQNAIVSSMEPGAALTKDQLEGDGGIVEILECNTATEEATVLAERIHGWIERREIEPAEIAILVCKQVDLYATMVVNRLLQLGVRVRMDNDSLDLASEPLARLVADYLRVVYCSHAPQAYQHVLSTLTSLAENERQEERLSRDWRKRIDTVRKEIHRLGSPPDIDAVSRRAKELLQRCGRDWLRALSPDYSSKGRLQQVWDLFIAKLGESLTIRGEVCSAVDLVMGEQAVRVMTIHKSKGLEFDTVIVLGVEHETYWGSADEERCAFFVAVARAKRQLILTVAANRERPPSRSGRWDVVRSPHEEFLGYAAPYCG